MPLRFPLLLPTSQANRLASGDQMKQSLPSFGVGGGSTRYPPVSGLRMTVEPEHGGQGLSSLMENSSRLPSGDQCGGPLACPGKIACSMLPSGFTTKVVVSPRAGSKRENAI